MTEAPTAENPASPRLGGALELGIRENKKIGFPLEKGKKSLECERKMVGNKNFQKCRI